MGDDVDESGAGNERCFEKCFLFLFGKDHDACALRKMTTERGEGYNYASVESALQSYDRESERKTKLRGFSKVPYAETDGKLRVFADRHAPCIAGALKEGGYQVVCNGADAVGLATDYEEPAWESMREWLSQSDYNEGYDPAADGALQNSAPAQAEMNEKDQGQRQGEAVHSSATPPLGEPAEQNPKPDSCELTESDRLQDQEDLTALHGLPSVHVEGQVYFVDKDGDMEPGIKNLAILETNEKDKFAEPAGIYDADKHVVVRFTLDQALDLFGDDPDAFYAYLTGGGLHNAATGGALHFTSTEAQAMYDAEFVDMVTFPRPW